MTGDPPLVTIYSKWACGYCMWARRLIASKGVAWQEIPVTFRPHNFREMMERSGGRTTAPQIFVGAHHVGGYRELVELDSHGKLDGLLQGASEAEPL